MMKNPSPAPVPDDDQIQQFLRDNGSPEHIVRAGRRGLTERWQGFVDEVERGYEFGLEDYRNDLDLRGIIQDLGLASDPAIVAADERLQLLLVPAAKRVWESCAGDHFWDFGYPKHPGRELERDLEREGLIA